MGLPATGKTTFLAALWHLVESGEIADALRLVKLEGDREYVNDLTRRWLRCDPMPRTPAGTEQLVSMRLADQATNNETDVVFPDLSGEAFRNQWSQRTWSESYQALVDDAAGTLLVVHPERIVEPYRIDEARELIEAVGGGNEEPADSSNSVGWSHDLSPTQVILIDLLQLIEARRTRDRPLRLAILVSAWDTVANTQQPDAWLTARLPLLRQYLSCNESFWSTRLYGISAQGGDLQQNKTALLRHMEPSRRLKIVGADSAAHDLTAPIRWLLS